MKEDDLLLAGIADKIDQCERYGMLTHSHFLDLRQGALARAYCANHHGLQALFYGGYKDAERIIVVFLPDYLTLPTEEGRLSWLAENEEENPLTVLRVQKDPFHTLTHRDYLGALMGLGVKRETVGDLLVREDGCDIILLKSVAPYLQENLTQAGRAKLGGSFVPVAALQKGEEKREMTPCVVASLRLDNVVSAAFSVSRSAATQAIQKGLVFVNALSCEKTAAPVKEGDRIVFRSKGKVRLAEVGRTSKKRQAAHYDRTILLGTSPTTCFGKREAYQLPFITQRSGVTKQGLPSPRGTKRYALLTVTGGSRLFSIFWKKTSLFPLECGLRPRAHGSLQSNHKRRPDR